MQCATPWGCKPIMLWLGSRAHTLAMVGLVLMALCGQPVESSLGWVACPPPVAGLPVGKRKGFKSQRPSWWAVNFKVGWEQMRRTWILALARGDLIAGLWLLNTHCGGTWMSEWVIVLPWAEWLLGGLSAAWPWLGRQPEMRLVRRVLSWLRWGSTMLLIGEGMVQQVRRAWEWGQVGSAGMLVGGMVQGQRNVVGEEEETEPQIKVTVVEGGRRIEFPGGMYLVVKDQDTFWVRIVILFLRQLEGPTARRGSRATRDGRRPLISQQQLAELFGVPQPNISRWEKYWLERDWANLLSLHSAEALTAELRAQIVDVCARFPWWGQKKVYKYLQEQGVDVTYRQIRQAIEDSGWKRLQETMSHFFVVSAECIRPRDEGLVKELLAMTQELLGKLEAGEGLTPQKSLAIAHLQTLCAEMGLTPPQKPATPWAKKLKWMLFAAEAPAKNDVVRCTYCGSTDVRRKGNKPRLKRYLDEHDQWQTIKVYRYRCRNSDCEYGSFTHLPLGLLPHSPYPLAMRVTALQMYAWGRSSYRRTAQALGVNAGRAYEWVSAFGQELLPVAAMFGVVHCSGVIGVDEKWVQVPDKNPRGGGRADPPKPRRWMYVYLAVDAYTYDLLHIAIYKYNTADSTRAFLLALKAKGYKPKIIVTDLRKEYGPAIGKIFPHARHHECIFHALQWSHRQLKEVYGPDYAKTHPEAVKLKEQIDDIFRAKTRRTAEKRYAKVMALREKYVTQTPQVACLFNTLQRHWPKLVNGIESTIIPRTNNTVELVIRRFDQHYQNFCGFESQESAGIFLGIFAKVYRFTPFTQDAQPRIRGKSPLELAGYDISKLPMTQVCRGWTLGWSTLPTKGGVPNG